MLIWNAGPVEDCDSSYFVSVQRLSKDREYTLDSYTCFLTQEKWEDGWLPFIVKLCEERVRPRKDDRPFYGKGLAELIKIG